MLSESLVDAAWKQGIEKFVVGAVIHRDATVLVVTRSTEDDFLPGIQEVPSGGVEAGESLRDALDRELDEEVGFAAGEIDQGFLAAFDYTSGSGRLTRQFTVSVPSGDRTVRLSSEHSSLAWIGPGELDETTATPETRQVLSGWFAWQKNALGPGATNG